MPSTLDNSPASRLTSTAAPLGVDRRHNVLLGYVVAMKGDFKSSGRGTFNVDSLERIVMLGNKWSQGLKSRFSHPTECSDGLGSFLGRSKNFRLAPVRRYDGIPEMGVRADLHFDRTALKEPPRNGGRPLGLYVMDLAESDPDALSSSLVLRVHRIEQVDEKGKKKVDENGDPLPPLWLPRQLSASDVVDTGDAVDGILSGGSMLAGADPFTMLASLLDAPINGAFGGGVASTAAAVLNRLFEGRDRDDVASRIDAFKRAYITRRFGG